MKTRDIKTIDSADTSADNQETTATTQPLSSPTRPRVSRNSHRRTPSSEEDPVQNKIDTSAEIKPIQRDVQHTEYKDAPPFKDEHNNRIQQQHTQTYPQGTYERPAYNRRPLEDLSLAELVQYARRYGIMGAAITKKDELLKKV